MESRKLVVIALTIIAVLVLITFLPALKVGFFGDEWLIAKAARLSLPQYLTFYFDPGIQIYWYRPLHGMLLLVEYAFFRSSPDGYHAIQVLIHLVNCLLFFAIVFRLSRQWRLAFVSAVLYAGLAPGSWAVYWITVHDPLATAFSLMAIWFWVVYLQTDGRLYYLLAFGALVAALLSKESNVFLPLTLFLVDRLLVRKSIGQKNLLRRYITLGLVLSVYLAIAYQVQTRGYFVQQQGYGLGPHMLDNALRYLGLLVLPWGVQEPMSYVWLLTALVLLGVVVKRSGTAMPFNVLLFLGIEALLAIAPILGFPTTMFEPRYLYTAAMASSAAFALLFEGAWASYARHQWYRVVLSAAVVLLMFFQSSSTSQTAEAAAEFTRQARVTIRDIFQQHPKFPPDTYLYFANGCTVRLLAGIFFLHYGSNVTVMCPDVELGGVDPEGTEENQFAGLRDHKNSFVYYYDDAKRRHEIQVDQSASTLAAPVPPIDLQKSIRLEEYEVTGTTLKHGDALGLFLYWKAKEPLDKDYTVFVHLVDRDGQPVIGEDSQPQGGFAPTGTWKKDKLVVDPHILPVTSDVPVGANYRLEVGLYHLPTMERVGIVDPTGKVIADTLVIQPFSVVD